MSKAKQTKHNERIIKQRETRGLKKGSKVYTGFTTLDKDNSAIRSSCGFMAGFGNKRDSKIMTKVQSKVIKTHTLGKDTKRVNSRKAATVFEKPKPFNSILQGYVAKSYTGNR